MSEASSLKPIARGVNDPVLSCTCFKAFIERKPDCAWSRAGPKLRALARSLESRPIIARLQRILLHWKARRGILPRSLLGQAIAYALGQWDSLQIFLRDGRLEIDNNLVENCIRPTCSPLSLPPLVPGAAASAVGKKNWLFIGATHAGQRGAIIYTLIESCRRRGIDPYAYLRDVLTRLPSMTTSQIQDLTPEAWAKAQRFAALRAVA